MKLAWKNSKNNHKQIFLFFMQILIWVSWKFYRLTKDRYSECDQIKFIFQRNLLVVHTFLSISVLEIKSNWSKNDQQLIWHDMSFSNIHQAQLICLSYFKAMFFLGVKSISG